MIHAVDRMNAVVSADLQSNIYTYLTLHYTDKIRPDVVLVKAARILMGTPTPNVPVYNTGLYRFLLDFRNKATRAQSWSSPYPRSSSTR